MSGSGAADESVDARSGDAGLDPEVAVRLVPARGVRVRFGKLVRAGGFVRFGVKPFGDCGDGGHVDVIRGDQDHPVVGPAFEHRWIDRRSRDPVVSGDAHHGNPPLGSWTASTNVVGVLPSLR